jgi:hypothetical protein
VRHTICGGAPTGVGRATTAGTTRSDACRRVMLASASLLAGVQCGWNGVEVKCTLGCEGGPAARLRHTMAAPAPAPDALGIGWLSTSHLWPEDWQRIKGVSCSPGR